MIILCYSSIPQWQRSYPALIYHCIAIPFAHAQFSPLKWQSCGTSSKKNFPSFLHSFPQAAWPVNPGEVYRTSTWWRTLMGTLLRLPPLGAEWEAGARSSGIDPWLYIKGGDPTYMCTCIGSGHETREGHPSRRAPASLTSNCCTGMLWNLVQPLLI